RAGAGPGSGSTATCRRRWASVPGNPCPRPGARPPPPAVPGRRRSRTPGAGCRARGPCPKATTPAPAGRRETSTGGDRQTARLRRNYWEGGGVVRPPHCPPWAKGGSMFRVLRWLPFGAALRSSVIAAAAVACGKARPEVLRAVRTGEARVLVALDVAPQRDPAGLARAVAQAQERVLAGVDPSAVRVVSRMDHLPILSMDLGRDGLEQLLAQP